MSRFLEVGQAAGFTHRHHAPVLDPVLENVGPWVSSVGAAAAVADFDGDGRMDLFATQSSKGVANHLYRNRGDGTFVDVAREAGLADLNGEDGTCMDAVWGDHDNDGWVDLFVVRWGRDALFHNRGDGTFEDVTAKLFRRRDGTPGTDWANGCAATWLDQDVDGRLDVYVGNFFPPVDLWHLESTRIMHDDFEAATNGGPDSLYHQQPDGTFVDRAKELGLDDTAWTLAVGSADLDRDGRPDLHVANDFGADRLLLSSPDGTLRDATATALGFDTKKGMNVDFGDFNNDGWLDVYVTNITTAEYLQEGNMLWLNQGTDPDGVLRMTDVALEAGAYDGGWGWGARFFDFDNDGDLDIVTVNGFISAGPGDYWFDLASWTVEEDDVADSRNWPRIGDRSFSGFEPTRLFRNDGLATFTEVAKAAGIDDLRDGRGVACFDFDDDGDLDVYVANQAAEPSFYRNDLAPGRHWLGVKLVADPTTGVNRDGVGTRVELVTERGRQVRERDGGNGYCAQGDPRLHFGLGDLDRAARLEVRWPDGGTQVVENPPIDRYLVVAQDPALYRAAPAAEEPAPPAAVTPRAAPAARAPAAPAVAARAERLPPDELEALLRRLEAELSAGVPGHSVPSRYRSGCAAHGQHDRAIAFLMQLVEQRPDDHVLRLELACAYIDQIPTRGGIAAVVSKGTLARRALDQVDVVLAARPDAWSAWYAQGMNHLHWPRALRHQDDAVDAFERCLELESQRPGSAPDAHDLLVRIALGDAWAKDGRPEEARAVWSAALQAFPGDTRLEERLAVAGADALRRFVESKRSLEQPIDTDLSFLDRRP